MVGVVSLHTVCSFVLWTVKVYAHNTMISNEVLLDFLIKCGVACSDLDALDGHQIPREILLDDARYEKAKTCIPELKKCFSSSSLTSLQAGAEDNQRWPLINILRQVLKSSNYRLCPRRMSDGYTPAGKKKYRRVFEIRRLNHVCDDGVPDEK